MASAPMYLWLRRCRSALKHLPSRRLAHWLLPGALLLVSLIWAATIAPRVWVEGAVGELFEAWEMKDLRVEEAREMGGLLIVAVWMLVLCTRSRGLKQR